MGGMKEEANRITIPPLFPRVHHVNDSGRGGLSHPFDGKSMSLHKPSPTNKISDSPSTLSLPPPANDTRLTDQPEKNHFTPICNTSPTSKLEESLNKNGMNDPSPRGSSVTNTKPSPIKQNEYHFKKSLANLDSPVVKRSQINTDLPLQFCDSSSSKDRGEAVGSKAALNNLLIPEVLLPQCSEDESQNESLNVMRTQLYKRKTVPPREDVSDCSAIDSLSGMSQSSNDVARVIGDKRFWKMRTYMINQQEIFAAQVFELHRLIMVQKMVAKSPNFVLESKVTGGKHGTMRPFHSHLASSRVKKPITEKHMKPKLPLPSINKNLMTPIWTQQLLPPPPGNQWLVPVMSPSEGLVYKPYTGPFPPPPSSFMVPYYGQDSFMFPVSTQFSHNYTLDQKYPFGQRPRWSSTTSHMTQEVPFSLKKSQESNDSGSTASSPPEREKFNALPLFPTEPTHHNDEYEKKQKPLPRAIKAIPHTSTSASKYAARIFRSIQEERRESDHMIT